MLMTMNSKMYASVSIHKYCIQILLIERNESYELYLQVFSLCGNMCNYNLMIIIINGLMEWMINIMWTYI